MQSNATVGRVLLAGLHQAIGEILPGRLDFYEKWLKPSEPAGAELSMASFMAMLNFLRQDRDTDIVIRRAGQYAALRSFEELLPIRRAFLRVLPRRLRAQKGVRLVAAVLPALFPEARIDMTRRGSTVFIGIEGSPFCATSQSSDPPSCNFYSAAIVTFLEKLKLRPAVRVSRCRASGDKTCLLTVLPDAARTVSGGDRTVLGLTDDLVAASEQEPASAHEPNDPGSDRLEPDAAGSVRLERGDVASVRLQPDDAGSVRLQPDHLDRSEIEARWEAIGTIPTSMRDVNRASPGARPADPGMATDDSEGS